MVENIGKRIGERRQALQMTLAELGDRVGVGASTVRKWEAGLIKNMRSDKIKNVAAALDVTPAYLMGWDEIQNVNVDNIHANNGIIGQANAPVTITNVPGEPLSKEELEIIRIYRELSVKKRIKLLTTALDLETEEGEDEK